jgi:caffeoyl-CoA O-methyltransferase
MPEITPRQIDQFVEQLFGRQHSLPVYESAVAEMKADGLPPINVSASQGMVLHALVRAVGAKRILEIGTLGGYSAIWLASALPESGSLISLEIDEKHAATARKNIAAAGLSDKVAVRVGPALDSLATMEKANEGGFDITFIDADKDSYPDYLDCAIKLTRIGGIILSDNTLGHGALDPNAETGITRFNQKLAATPGLISAIIPTMRDHIDGLTLSVLTSK